MYVVRKSRKINGLASGECLPSVGGGGGGSACRCTATPPLSEEGPEEFVRGHVVRVLIRPRTAKIRECCARFACQVLAAFRASRERIGAAPDRCFGFSGIGVAQKRNAPQGRVFRGCLVCGLAGGGSGSKSHSANQTIGRVST